MNVLVLGWEYPPFHSGGLGVASKNLTAGLALNPGLKLHFALPAFVYDKVNGQSGHNEFDLVKNKNKNIKIKKIASTINSPYLNEINYQEFLEAINLPQNVKEIYGKNLFEEIERYALEMENFVNNKKYDLVHAHDWITFEAGIKIKNKQNIPLIAHVHATEYDRTGGNPAENIYQKERRGMEKANKIIAVSNYTKEIIKKEYGIPEHKINVVHNGVETSYKNTQKKERNPHERKTVLFLGRLTLQKGPDWFIHIAKKVLEQKKDVDFLIAGEGEMMPRLVKDVIENELKDHVHFLGFVGEKEREKAFRNSDAYILSSVSEPFGLSAVEAAQRGVPVALSKQSGVREVLYHSLQADFWDIDKMANNILAILEYPALSKTLANKATNSLVHLTWENQAKIVNNIYCELKK